MTDIAVPAPTTSRRLTGLRPFFVAFLAGVMAVMALGAGALLAYERSYEGRVLPGVMVGTVDLGGLTPEEAQVALATAYGNLADGEIVLETGVGPRRLTYAQVDRRPDLDAMVAAAMAAGRDSDGLGQLVDNARTALSGISLGVIVALDREALAEKVTAIANSLEREPVDAWVSTAGETFEVQPGTDGRIADPAPAIAELEATLARIDAPDQLTVALPTAVVEPAITTSEAAEARAAAERIVQDVTVALDDATWTIPAATIREWVSFAATPDGRYEPVLATAGVGASLAEVAKDVKRAPKNASFLIGKNGAVVGVTAGANGRDLDASATGQLVTDVLRSRAAGLADTPVAPALKETKPALTTEEAEASAPLMQKISTWTTWFPISEKNGNGANIWIPAEDIDGYVVGPGEWFDFWNAIGPVTRARGYRDGGAIINGRTEPQGALAGGICSTSTTLFNAALRAGFEMADRRNHYYYIDRYPLGLDATVFKSGSGSVQNMRWRNDTKYPVLVRGYKIREGSKGYVRFDLWSVPNGRQVSLSKPTVKNVTKATDTVEYTAKLPAGKRERIEYPVDGKDVWVTWTVRENGEILHQKTYYSKYARITGVTLVGTGGASQTSGGSGSGSGGGTSPAATPKPPAPTPAPPTPAPTPEPTPAR